MATAKSTDNQYLTEDYSCGYCLQRLAYMTDARELPCGHVFCLPCLQADYLEINAVRCNICSKVHNVEQLGELPTPNLVTSDGKDEEHQLVMSCDVCTEEPSEAVCYCSDCNKKLCQQHREAHDTSMRMFLGRDHSVISAEEFKLDSLKYQRQTCQDHGEEVVEFACSSCYQTFCTLCQTESVCTGTEGGMQVSSHHKIIKVGRLTEQLRETMKAPLRALSDRITHVCKLEKTAWRSLDSFDVQTKERVQEVDRTTEEQIAEIKKVALAEKQELKQQFNRKTEEVESYTGVLTSAKEKMQLLWSEVQRVVMGSDIELLRRHTDIMKLMEQSLDGSLSGCRLSDNITGLQIPTLDRLKAPTALDYKEHEIFSSNTVSWNSEDGLVYGGEGRLYLLDSKFASLSTKNFYGNVCAVAEIKPGHGYVAYKCARDKFKNKEGTVCKIDLDCQLIMYSSDLTKTTTLDSYTRDYRSPIRISRQLAVNTLKSQFVAICDGELQVYNAEGDLRYSQKLKNVSFLKCVHCLPDGSVLILDDTYLYKCNVNPPPGSIEVVWKSVDLSSPQGISADSAGFIYVGQTNSGNILIFSSTGVHIFTLTHQRLIHSTIEDIAVSRSGDQIAVACGNNGLWLFGISRKVLQ